MSKPNKTKLIKRWFTLTELLAVTSIITSIPTGAFINAKQRALELKCFSNIRQVGLAITTFQLSNDEYPKAAFYPENPRTDKDSIRVILGPMGGDDLWVCPAMPDKLKEKGLTWVYNDALAGKSVVANPAKTWMLIEFSCVTKKVPSAHPNGFNIVYADGHVETTTQLPAEITKLQQAKLDELSNLLPEA